MRRFKFHLNTGEVFESEGCSSIEAWSKLGYSSLTIIVHFEEMV